MNLKNTNLFKFLIVIVIFMVSFYIYSYGRQDGDGFNTVYLVDEDKLLESSNPNQDNNEPVLEDSEVGAEVSENKIITNYYGKTFDLFWPDLNEIFNYLSHNRFQSTFSHIDSHIYEVDIHVKDKEISFGISDGVYNMDNSGRLFFDYTYTEDKSTFMAASENINILTDFVGANIVAYNMLNDKYNYITSSDFTDYVLKQKLEYKDNKYIITQTKTYKNNNKVDIYEKLATAIENGEFFDDLDGYQKLDNLSKNSLANIVEKLRLKNINLDIEIMALPNWYLSEETRSAENAYRLYNVKFKDNRNSGLSFVLNIDGVDRFNIGRLYYLSVHDISNKNNLKTQEVADYLGLGFDKLVTLVDKGERVRENNVSYALFESDIEVDEVMKDFTSVIRATYNYNFEDKEEGDN